MKKNKYHREHSKRAMEILKNTDYSKCTAETMAAEIRKHQRQAFEQEFGAVSYFMKVTVKTKRMDILQTADYAPDFKSLSQFIPAGEDKQFRRSLFLMLRLGRYLRN